MRQLVTALVLTLSVGMSVHSQQKQVSTNPGSKCGEQSKGLPDFYYEAVLSNIRPPDWKASLIRIVIGGNTELALWTNGEKFKLWTDTLDNTKTSIEEFLLHLDRSCRLPADPADAASLIKVKWQSRDLSGDQFAQLHRDFTSALSQYSAKMQERYRPMIATRTSVINLDNEGYSVVYDSSYEHVELLAWNRNEDHPLNPMVSWVHELQKLAESVFHRPFGPEAEH